MGYIILLSQCVAFWFASSSVLVFNSGKKGFATRCFLLLPKKCRGLHAPASANARMFHDNFFSRLSVRAFLRQQLKKKWPRFFRKNRSLFFLVFCSDLQLKEKAAFFGSVARPLLGAAFGASGLACVPCCSAAFGQAVRGRMGDLWPGKAKRPSAKPSAGRPG